jgi:hypothetical protein
VFFGFKLPQSKRQETRDMENVLTPEFLMVTAIQSAKN